MILNDLDFGPGHPSPQPISGQVLGSALVEGSTTIAYPRGASVRTQTVTFWAAAWQAIGGAAANTQAALQYLLKQGEELAGNPALNPVYIQWSASAAAGAINVTTAHDGWYVLESFEPDYEHFVPGGLGCQVRMTVAWVAAGSPSRLGMYSSGGALSSNYNGAALNLVGFRLGDANQPATAVSRTGGEGAIPVTINPAGALNPLPITPSSTVSNWFKGGCRVYDGASLPPFDGTFANTGWVEVKGTDHVLQSGYLHVTNGLILIRFVLSASPSIYVWDTSLATPAWNSSPLSLGINDNGGNGLAIRQFTVDRIGLEECRISVTCGLNATWAKVVFRLSRGRYDIRVDFTPLTYANSAKFALTLGSGKIVYNSAALSDGVVDTPSLAPPSDYGYCAETLAGAGQPIWGFLYQNQPTTQGTITSGSLVLGDNSGPAQNATRSYGVFAIPYGVNGSYTTANLQAEAESGTLGTGWTSQANAAASNGNEAKCASGTASTNADLFGTAFVPDPGVYDLWMRVKVTSAAGAASEMQLGLWNSTDSVFVASTTYKANQVTTGYAWYRVAASVTPTATKNMRYRAVTTATLGTDWFIDEAALVPLSLTTDYRGPQDLWQQFMYDRFTALVRS